MIYRRTLRYNAKISIFLYPLFADFYFRDQKSFPFYSLKKSLLINYWIAPDGLEAELPKTPKMEKIIKKLQRKEAAAKH